MWLNLTYFVTLMYISEGYLNKRLQSFYENLQQKKLIFSFGSVPDAYDPYSYLRRSSPDPDDRDPYSYLRDQPDDHDPFSYFRAQPDDRNRFSYFRAQPADPHDRDQYFYLREQLLERRQPRKRNNKITSNDKSCLPGVESLEWLYSGVSRKENSGARLKENSEARLKENSEARLKEDSGARQKEDSGARRTEDSKNEWVNYKQPSNPNLDHTLFCPILAKESGAIKVTDEAEYPWLARVYHNQPQIINLFTPLICTAAAVAERIFITAARCIESAKLDFTTVQLNDMRFGVDAFVYPLKASKQMFDDIALIVTSKGDYEKFWKTPPKLLKLLEKPVRPDADDHYNWFQEWVPLENTNTVVGFLEPEETDRSTKPPLYKLNQMYASNFLCNKILPIENDSNDYWVPCAHSCTPGQHLNGTNCPYLIGLGHVVLDKNANLIGVVTWNCEHGVSLGSPVGIAVPNTAEYSLYLKCAKLLVEKFKRGSELITRTICDEGVFSTTVPPVPPAARARISVLALPRAP